MRFPGLRALAWSGEELYASRGYELLRASIQNPPTNLPWQSVGTFRPAWRRRFSAMTRLSSRLFRDGFHALAIHSSGSLIAAVPGAIISLRPGETEFLRAYTFPKGSIRHVHNIVHDPWENCLWVLTGDYGNECRILRASCDFSRVDTVLQGNQQARAVALVPTEDGLYFSSDTPLEANFIYRLDRIGTLSQLAPISSSSIYGCRVGDRVFFSTMVEPSEVNRDQDVRIYAGNLSKGWQPLLSWRKDRWPMSLFQYGNASLPDGTNMSNFLAVTTVAVEADDMVTSLYSIP